MGFTNGGSSSLPGSLPTVRSAARGMSLCSENCAIADHGEQSSRTSITVKMLKTDIGLCGNISLCLLLFWLSVVSLRRSFSRQRSGRVAAQPFQQSVRVLRVLRVRIWKSLLRKMAVSGQVGLLRNPFGSQRSGRSLRSLSAADNRSPITNSRWSPTAVPTSESPFCVTARCFPHVVDRNRCQSRRVRRRYCVRPSTPHATC